MNSRDDKQRQYAYRAAIDMLTKTLGDGGKNLAAAYTGPIAEAYVGGGSQKQCMEKTEDDNVNPKVIQSPKQEVQTNSTMLSKQIKIVSQLNAKQVDGLISDRNTIKAHGS